MRTPGAVVALAQGVRSSNRRGLKVWGCFMGVFFFRGCPRCRRIEANHPYSAAGASFASLWLLHPSGGTGATGDRLQATGRSSPPSRPRTQRRQLDARQEAKFAAAETGRK